MDINWVDIDENIPVNEEIRLLIKDDFGSPKAVVGIFDGKNFYVGRVYLRAKVYKYHLLLPVVVPDDKGVFELRIGDEEVSEKFYNRWVLNTNNENLTTLVASGNSAYVYSVDDEFRAIKFLEEFIAWIPNSGFSESRILMKSLLKKYGLKLNNLKTSIQMLPDNVFKNLIIIINRWT